MNLTEAHFENIYLCNNYDQENLPDMTCVCENVTSTIEKLSLENANTNDFNIKILVLRHSIYIRRVRS